MRKFAISDIHGCFLSFEALLDKIALSTSDCLYLLGDYIDRGPDSKKVIDKILQLRKEGYQVDCLAGNHDYAITEAKVNPSFFAQWHNGWGGKQTMEGFDVNTLDHIGQEYWDFFNSLEMTFEVDNYILVHAGLDFTINDPLRPNIEMLYIRDWYDQINYDWLGDRVIVHGHTPVSHFHIRAMVERLDEKKFLDIDGGCFAEHFTRQGQFMRF